MNCIEKWKDKDHLYFDELSKMYYIHDTNCGYDYRMGNYDIERNIGIAKRLTGKAQFLNAILKNGKIVLVDSINDI